MTAAAQPTLVASTGWWRSVTTRVLRLPLVAKLAGANALIVVLAWTAAYLDQRGRTDDWRLLAVLAVALATGLAVNMVLLFIALRPIRMLEATAARVWEGDLGARVPWSAVADRGIEKLSIALNLLLESLSTDRLRARALTERIAQQGDEHRAEVARELQESIAQSLAGLLYTVTAAREECQGEECLRNLDAARDITLRCIEELRELSGRVHPRLLDDFGLIAALRHMARTMAPPNARVRIAVRHDGVESMVGLSASRKALLYRVTEEACRNAVRHAWATQVEIRITATPGSVSIDVVDDGVGHDVSADGAAGTGLGLIRERLALAGGESEVCCTAGQGTHFSVRLPFGATIIEAPRIQQTA